MACDQVLSVMKDACNGLFSCMIPGLLITFGNVRTDNMCNLT